MKSPRTVALLTALLTVWSVGCSSDTPPGGTAGGTPPGTAEAPGPPRPPGPAAVLAGPLTAGRGIFLGARPGVPTGGPGWVEQEFTATGTATSYRSAGDLPADGTFALTPDTTAEYATRLVVRRPPAGAFNGTAVVEWLNVSGGVDAAPNYTYVAEEVIRKGYAWIGVSAQSIGIEGGRVAVMAPGAEEAGAGKGLKGIDPGRYGSLRHPGDAYAYDIYTQVARALRTPGAVDALGGLGVRRTLAVGESQSAFMLTTYYNGVQPLTQAFDGFFIHSRGGPAGGLGTAGGGNDMASALAGKPTRLRTDQRAPAIVVQTESDVLGVLSFYPARQPDHDRLRVWEVAGTAHADKFQLGDTEPNMGCGQPVNRGQQYVVLRAALRHLDRWSGGGQAPPSAEPLAVDTASGKPAFVLDPVGNVTGGVRTPAVDAPVDVLSGLPGPSSAIVCILSGTTTPLTRDQLAARYPSKDDYLARYRAATDQAVERGFVLAEDRDAVLAEADAGRL